MNMTQTAVVRDLMSRSGVTFGTSGVRGEAVAMTDRICFAYTAGFLQHLRDEGEFGPGKRVALAGDLRSIKGRIEELERRAAGKRRALKASLAGGG